MSRYLGATCKISRRYKLDLDFKSRDIATKCRYSVAPGVHGAKKKRVTPFSKQLAAKQALRFKYGMTERQFKRFYVMATKKAGSTGENLLKILEMRLDNVVYQMGFARTRKEARQLVSHRGVRVNGAICNIPSALMSPEAEIALTEKSSAQERVDLALQYSDTREERSWLQVNPADKVGVVKRLPDRDELPTDINENLVVELYSK